MLNKETLNNLAQEIWKSAESLRGKFKAYEYQNIVLPMITIRRIECVLQTWREQEQATIGQKFPNDSQEQIQERLKKAEKRFRFWNSSDKSLHSIHQEAPQLLEDHFRDYLKAYSPNIQTIIDHFNFRETIGKLKKSGRLNTIVEQYANQDLSLERLSNLEMGYVYEELLRRFSEQSGEEAGEHFTPREVIRLMVELLDIQFSQDLQSLAIYDPACGTGGMLSVAKTHLLDQIDDPQKRLAAEKLITLYGQELQPHNYAICQAEMLLKDDQSFIYLGNSLIPYHENRDDKGDQLSKAEDRFDYMLSNPPFGVTWSDYKSDADKFNSSRYQAGMPRSNDGALLFLQTMLTKMKPVDQGGSKCAIVFNGSPLSNGDCGSGESEIRRWIIENDWLDAIVMLPDQLFYNTGIYTYIWLLGNNKPDSHKNQIKIIDAREQYEKEPKSFGNKRNRMSDSHRLWVKAAYQHHWQNQDDARIKLFKPSDFAYHKVSVVFWQTDENDQPAYITEPYEKALTPAVIKKEQAFYSSELVFDMTVSDGKQHKPLTLSLQPSDVFDTVYRKAVKALFKDELKQTLSTVNDKDQAAAEKTFINGLNVTEVQYRHRHYVQDNEYIPHGEDILAFLQREIAKPIIRWQDSPQLGYEILPNKYFYRYQAPKPTADLLAEFWALEQAAVSLLKSLED
ncbi:MAG: class I SAM-dependent DNA methyltransferase [Methylococcales bacterium]|nr:class I SAM-dependent DNA methyltransferase [Methylococcales bacterium]